MSPTGRSIKPNVRNDKQQSFARKTSAIYTKGDKFKRFSSGRVNPKSRCSSSVSREETKDFLRTFPTNTKCGSISSGCKGGSISSSINSSAETLMYKQSFQNQLGIPNVNMKPVSPNSLYKNKNSILLREVPSASYSNSSSCDDTMMLQYLVGGYKGADINDFAISIANELNGISDISEDSIIDFFLSDDYKFWVREKNIEWKEAELLKRTENNNSKKILQGEMNGTVTNNSFKEKRPLKDTSSPIIQIFHDCSSSETHVDYEIKIKTRQAKFDRMIKNNCLSKNCTLL